MEGTEERKDPDATQSGNEREERGLQDRAGEFVTDLERAFDSFRRQMMSALSSDPRSGQPSYGWNPPVVSAYSPLVDLEDRGDTYVLSADLPGVSRDDMDILVNEDSVELRAESSSRRDEEGGNFIQRERSHSSFRRSFHLPRPVNPDRAKGSLDNGTLVVTMPKKDLSPESKPRKIDVE